MTILCLHYPAGIEPRALRALGEACLRLSSQVALREGEAAFLEADGSRLLYGEAGLRARLQALGRRFSGVVAPRLGQGRDAGEALALARFAPAGGAAGLPLQALECYASPFQADDAVGAALAPLIAALQALGLRTLGELRALPVAGLGERFGRDAETLLARVEGRFPMAWARFEPAPVIDESLDLRSVESQSAGLSDEALRFHLKGLADRAAARLRGRGLRAAALQLRVGFERVRGLVDLADWVLVVTLPLPIAAPRELGQLLLQRLEAEAQRRPLPRAIAALGLRISATAPGFSPQRDAFDRHEDETEALHGLLARLTERLGEDHVFYAELLQRYLPEQAWRKKLGPAAGQVGRVLAPAAEERAGVARPSRLLRRPLLLTRSGDWLLYWGGGRKGRRWRALDWQGPERLGTAWWQSEQATWDQDSPGRDYWRVRTEAGPDLWVFSRAGEEHNVGACWLQGWWG